ncbi:MAG: dipeptidase [Candidatus Aminicenantes bacterium]|nr:dipeptidase [Candidatus Aminicenantes bacterium]NIQ65189.1 dipeptidase [Candidatus Aminicenantes bacterium]NIT21192.1 dipeptidase [Candidatus Aminicenantes bacterium]
MKRTVLIITLGIVFVLSMVVFNPSVEACTNYLISKGATVDGSTMISFAADSHVLYGELYYTPAADHMEGEMLDIYEWDSGKYLGKIKQVPHTYAVVGLMNEHQVSIGETTWGGRRELRDPNAIMDYGSLMFIALQRAKTAREAINVMTHLMAEYGYHSSGESLSISDANEVWIMEMISKGKDNKGAVWVARRVPDGYVCAHANQARIRQFPLNDPKNCLYAKDVISFAREKGYFKGEDKDFSFADAYGPLDFGALRFCEARVWSMFNRVTQKSKAMEKYLDYAMGHNPNNPMPLWIKPDKKLTVRDVMELMRDHFEGTPMDMTKDVGAGPFRLPYRWRPLTWKLEDKKDAPTYVNERAVSTQQTGFSFVSQSRSWLPDPIGGIHWFGVDDTYSTVYVPMYCGIRKVPKSYAVGTGSFHEFTWESAFWVFNFVSNYAYSRYCDIIQDIQILQRELEGKFLTLQTEVDKVALELFKKSPELARNYLTEYTVKEGNAVVKRWKKLGEFLLYKYLDGNVKTGLGKLSNNGYPKVGEVTHPGYPKAWYKHIVKETGDHFKYKPLETEKKDEGH